MHVWCCTVVDATTADIEVDFRFDVVVLLGRVYLAEKVDRVSFYSCYNLYFYYFNYSYLFYLFYDDLN